MQAKQNGRMRLGQIAMVFAAAWFAVHVALYVARTSQIDLAMLRQIGHAPWRFFLWQMAAFVVLTSAVGILRPASLGRAFGVFLVVSTLVLLAYSHNAVLVAKFTLLALWAACAVNGVRLAVARIAGQRYATWGVAAAVVYAALIPLCFLLGLLHVITPPIVAALAVALALPGVANWLRRLPAILRDSMRRLERMDIVEIALIQTIWVMLAIGFVSASTSEVLSDSVRVHLPYIHEVVSDHGLSHQYPCWHRLQPMAVQTCCAALACLGSDAAAKWFSWLALPALTLLVSEEVFRRSRSLKLAIFGGAAVLGCPMLLWLSTSLYVDHVIALLCTAGFVVLFRALRPPRLRGILLSAALMGSMVQVKYPGLIFCAIWGLFLTVVLLRRCNWQVALRWSAAGGAVLLAVAVPWYAYVYAGTGNPVYPYLHNWFPSPYWADGFTLRQVFEENFKLSPGIGGVLSFPWTATLNTHRFTEQGNGFLGFWVLALAPCWFLYTTRPELQHSSPVGSNVALFGVQRIARSRRGPPYWDMAIAGVAMVAGVVCYTPYARYWLPAYPLLVTSCVLALSNALPLQWAGAGARHGLLGSSVKVACVIALVVLLLLPAPFACVRLPWNKYTGRVLAENQLTMRFGGIDAVRRLNDILRPEEGVICTGYEGVYLVRGRAYEFAFWWNKVHHIHDLQSFDDFRRRHGIRYWIVDYFSPASRAALDEEDIAANYWTDARMVAACGSVAVYDLGQLTESFNQRRIPHHCNGRALDNGANFLQAVLDKTKKPWSPSDTPAHWVNVTNDPATSLADGTIVISGQARIGHRLRPVLEGDLCKLKLDVWSKSEEPAHLVMEIVWYDAQGAVLSRVIGGAYGGQSDYVARLYAPVPPGAKTGWISLWEHNGQPIHLKQGTVTFLPMERGRFARIHVSGPEARAPTVMRGECDET